METYILPSFHISSVKRIFIIELLVVFGGHVWGSGFPYCLGFFCFFRIGVKPIMPPFLGFTFQIFDDRCLEFFEILAIFSQNPHDNLWVDFFVIVHYDISKLSHFFECVQM